MTDLELMRKINNEGYTPEVAKLMEQRRLENKGPLRYDGTLEDFIKEFDAISIEDFAKQTYNKFAQKKDMY